MPQTYHVKGPQIPGKRRVFLATPAYAGPSAVYTYSLANSLSALKDAGFSVDYLLLSGDCHVDDARNRLVREFLLTDCEDLVFLDADVGWEAADLLTLLSYDRDVVAGAYPLRSEDRAYPVQFPPGQALYSDRDGLLEADGVPTGFLRIRRSVLERLAAVAPKFHGKDRAVGKPPMPLIFERTLDGGNRYGGDYTFCRKWRAIGGRIYVAPEMSFRHAGEKLWEGSLGTRLRVQAHIALPKALQDIAAEAEGPNTIPDMVAAWGNGGYVASNEMLGALIALARDMGGAPILECGSGLSTLAMAAAGAQVVALEHDLAWATRVQTALEDHGLGSRATVHHAPLGEDGFYTLRKFKTAPFSMLVVDGPPRHLGDRGCCASLFDQLALDAVLVIDDAQDAQVSGIVAAHNLQLLGSERRFAVGRLAAQPSTLSGAA